MRPEVACEIELKAEHSVYEQYIEVDEALRVTWQRLVESITLLEQPER
jgi:hypothetical protein